MIVCFKKNWLTMLMLSLVLNQKSFSIMDSIFENCGSLIILNLSHFNIENVIIMLRMFKYCNGFNHLVLSPKIELINHKGINFELPAIPVAVTKVSDTDKAVAAHY